MLVSAVLVTWLCQVLMSQLLSPLRVVVSAAYAAHGVRVPGSAISYVLPVPVREPALRGGAEGRLLYGTG